MSVERCYRFSIEGILWSALVIVTQHSGILKGEDASIIVIYLFAVALIASGLYVTVTED